MLTFWYFLKIKFIKITDTAFSEGIEKLEVTQGHWVLFKKGRWHRG
jgi:hypothetical protein